MKSITSVLPGFLTADWVPGLNLLSFLGLFILLNVVLFTVMGLIWLERKTLGKIQLRPGPTLNGPHGLLQSPADAVKLLVKEDLTPAAADKRIFKMAPYLVFIPVFLVFLVVPWSRDVVVRALDLGLLLHRGHPRHLDGRAGDVRLVVGQQVLDAGRCAGRRPAHRL